MIPFCVAWPASELQRVQTFARKISNICLVLCGGSEGRLCRLYGILTCVLSSSSASRTFMCRYGAETRTRESGSENKRIERMNLDDKSLYLICFVRPPQGKKNVMNELQLHSLNRSKRFYLFFFSRMMQLYY